MKLAIVGVTGMVGGAILKVLAEFDSSIQKIIPVASKASAGKKISFRNQEYSVITLDDAIDEDIDIAIFSAGKTISKEWAPKFAAKGIYVVDNSSAWRMDSNIKLIVPEVNIALLEAEDKIIANPNCSTIQLEISIYGILTI